MKLPEDKGERIKLYALMGVVGVFLLYVGGGYAIKPLLKKRAEWKEQIEKLKLDIETTQRVLDFVGQSEDVNAEVVNEIVRIAQTSNVVLRPRLGNYQLEATERIEQRAAAAGVPIESIRETGVTTAPWSKDDGAFQAYGVRVETQCGLHDFVRLLQTVQSRNPYLCITDIAVGARPSTPGQHTVSFDLQWPIWKNQDALDEITQTLTMPTEP